MKDHQTSVLEFKKKQPEGCVLYLFVAGATPRSQRAVMNVKEICDDAHANVSELKVIDIFQQPSLAKIEQIVAVPALVKKLPKPQRFFIGDLTDKVAILNAINARGR